MFLLRLLRDLVETGYEFRGGHDGTAGRGFVPDTPALAVFEGEFDGNAAGHITPESLGALARKHRHVVVRRDSPAVARGWRFDEHHAAPGESGDEHEQLDL